jgi:hypothetical protein
VIALLDKLPAPPEPEPDPDSETQANDETQHDKEAV